MQGRVRQVYASKLVCRAEGHTRDIKLQGDREKVDMRGSMPKGKLPTFVQN